jgi:hypothetical protein
MMSLSILPWGYFARDLADMESRLTKLAHASAPGAADSPAQTPHPDYYKTEIGIIQFCLGKLPVVSGSQKM